MKTDLIQAWLTPKRRVHRENKAKASLRSPKRLRREEDRFLDNQGALGYENMERGRELVGGPGGMNRGCCMGIDEQTVGEIVRGILSVAKPDRIILFGSAVTGEMTPDSDIDLLIVEPDTSDRRNEYMRIIEALWGVRYPFDVLFISTERFEESKGVIGGIAYPAHKYGKVIYEAA